MENIKELFFIIMVIFVMCLIIVFSFFFTLEAILFLLMEKLFNLFKK